MEAVTFVISFRVFYLFQVIRHTGRIIALRKFVFHIQLIVHHIGEESLAQEPIAIGGQEQQSDHRQRKAKAVRQTETQSSPQDGIYLTFIYTLAGIIVFHRRM
jgi:hypothetical protein